VTLAGAPLCTSLRSGPRHQVHWSSRSQEEVATRYSWHICPCSVLAFPSAPFPELSIVTWPHCETAALPEAEMQLLAGPLPPCI